MKIFIRSLIITFWICLIFACLYFPKWKIFSTSKNTINVFTWGDILDPVVVEAFERTSGIKVRLNYYSSNEELLVKLKATRGEGYDLIIPSDYAVTLLAEEGLLKEIDRTKCPFWQDINPALLGHIYDPMNTYSIPFEWEVFGLGIDKIYFENHNLTPSWKLIFEEPSYRICMINDPIEAILFASFYLYGAKTQLTPPEIAGVKKLLTKQKKWVEAYASFRGDYFLATKSCPVVISSSSYIWRAMRKLPFISFVVPKEGSFITIENFCIPAPTSKEDLAYAFINFLFEPTSSAAHFRCFGLFPSNLKAIPFLEMDPATSDLFKLDKHDLDKFHFINMLTTEQEMRNLWVSIKK